MEMYNFDSGKEYGCWVCCASGWPRSYQALKVARLDIDKDIKWRAISGRGWWTPCCCSSPRRDLQFLVALVVQGQAGHPRGFTMLWPRLQALPPG